MRGICQLPKEKIFLRCQETFDEAFDDLSPPASKPGNATILITVATMINKIPPNHHLIQKLLLAAISACHWS